MDFSILAVVFREETWITILINFEIFSEKGEEAKIKRNPYTAEN